jgi:hypothetical protein
LVINGTTLENPEKWCRNGAKMEPNKKGWRLKAEAGTFGGLTDAKP